MNKPNTAAEEEMTDTVESLTIASNELIDVINGVEKQITKFSGQRTGLFNLDGSQAKPDEGYCGMAGKI